MQVNIFNREVDDFFFYIYDNETDATVSVSIDESNIENSEELEFFFDDKVRKVWHKQEEEWYFSIVDVCQVLTDSTDGRKYWNKLKQRLATEGNETVTNCHYFPICLCRGHENLTSRPSACPFIFIFRRHIL